MVNINNPPRAAHDRRVASQQLLHRYPSGGLDRLPTVRQGDAFEYDPRVDRLGIAAGAGSHHRDQIGQIERFIKDVLPLLPVRSDNGMADRGSRLSAL